MENNGVVSGIGRLNCRINEMDDLQERMQSDLYGGTGGYGLIWEIRNQRKEIEELKSEIKERAKAAESNEFERWKIDRVNRVTAITAAIAIAVSVGTFLADKIILNDSGRVEQSGKQT